MNTAGGWIGTAVLVLGVLGIVVPLVFRLSPWLIAVVLLGLLALVFAEGGYRVWRETDQGRTAMLTERDAIQDEMHRRFDAQRYALGFGGVDAMTHPAPHYATGTVELRLRLTNNSDDPLRFEVESMLASIHGRRSGNGSPVLNRGDVIPPHGSMLYMAPTVSGVRIPWGQGTLDVTVKYGPPSGPFRFRTSRRFALRASAVASAAAGRHFDINADLIGEPEIRDI